MPAYASEYQAILPSSYYVSATTANAIGTGGLARPVSLGESFEPKFATDYSYRPSWRMSRKWWAWWRDTLRWSEEGNDIFPFSMNWQKTYQAWYAYGWRVMIEFFDTNAIADFTAHTEGDADIEKAVRSFMGVEGPFACERLSDNLINITLK